MGASASGRPASPRPAHGQSGPDEREPQANRWPHLRRQLLSLLAWVSVALLLRWAVIEPRWIPSGSMLPALQLQDRVLVEKLRARLHRPIPLGAVVVFHPPGVLEQAGYDPSSALIKRVVGRPGDRIEVHDGRLWRNGAAVERDWSAEPMDYRIEAMTVPPGHLLVLGDNRNASLDSHLWGALPEDRLIGTAVWRYWPLDRFGPIRPGKGMAETSTRVHA